MFFSVAVNNTGKTLKNHIVHQTVNRNVGPSMINPLVLFFIMTMTKYVLKLLGAEKSSLFYKAFVF